MVIATYEACNMLIYPRYNIGALPRLKVPSSPRGPVELLLHCIVVFLSTHCHNIVYADNGIDVLVEQGDAFVQQHDRPSPSKKRSN